MPEKVDLGYAIGLPPEKAIAYLKQKGYQISWDWKEVWQQAHARAFTVAGVTKLEVLQDIRSAVDDALKNGTSLAGFERALQPVLERKGWWGKHAQIDKATGEMSGKGLTPYRLRTIYQTNMQTAYMAGRYSAMMDNVESRPLWEYVAVLDGRTRPAHRALDGKVFRFDDPFWDIFYPPNGFNCRCRVRARDKEDLRVSGTYLSNGYGRMEDIQVPVSPRRSTETVKVTGYREPGTNKLFTPDPGWSYNPAKQWAKPFTPPPLDDLPRTFSPGIDLPDLPKPVRLSGKRLLEQGLTPEQYAKAFLAEFNADIGNAVIYEDAAGDPVVISEDLFKDGAGKWKSDKYGRGIWMRLLAEAIKSPDEIWLRWEESRNKPGMWLLKRRYLKTYEMDDAAKSYGIAAFEYGADGWTGSSVFHTDAKDETTRRAYVEKQRDGFLRYRN